MRLIEFGDLDWIPSLYHLYLRKYLVFFYKLFGYHKLWVPGLSEFIRKTRSDTIMECCSGAGDPLQLVARELDDKEFSHTRFLLSDLKPLPEFVETVNETENSRFHYIEQPMDVMKIDENHPYPKVFINSFHHFSPEQAKTVLEVNLSARQDILILEYVRNTPLGYLSMLMGPVVLFLTLPFISKLKHLPVTALFTYIIPAFPLMFLWDGIVSCLHEHSESAIRQMIDDSELKDVEIHAEIRRNLLYPAGVSIIHLTTQRQNHSGS